PGRHQFPIVIGYRDDVRESPHSGALVAQHFPEFNRIHEPLDRVRMSARVPAPDLAFDIVLEEHARDLKVRRKIHGGIQEVADSHIKSIVAEPLLNGSLHLGTRKTPHRVRSRVSKMSEVIPGPACAVGWLTSADTDGSRKMIG